MLRKFLCWMNIHGVKEREVHVCSDPENGRALAHVTLRCHCGVVRNAHDGGLMTTVFHYRKGEMRHV